MSNTLDVTIRGIAPFDLGRDKVGNELALCIGILSTPTSGLKFNWRSSAPPVPSEYGGTTSMYFFELSGTEAIPVCFLQRFIAAVLGAGGAISRAVASDVDNRTGPATRWENIELPSPYRRPAYRIEVEGREVFHTECVRQLDQVARVLLGGEGDNPRSITIRAGSGRDEQCFHDIEWYDRLEGVLGYLQASKPTLPGK